MPTTAGGPDLAYNQGHDHSEQLEVELHPRILRAPKPPFVVRMLGFRNVGHMGRFRDALSTANPNTAPQLDGVRRSGAVKYGFGLNVEQALADGGDTGVFARYGWNDGATETFSFAESDRSISVGGQLSGAHWRRKDDRVGIAFGQSDISAAHKDYLAAGGQGASVGDGRLHYRSERIEEIYYSYQVAKPLAVTLDYQSIANPGYNRDRGPVNVVALRMHYGF